MDGFWSYYFYDLSGLSEEETGLIGGFLTYLYYRVADTRTPNPLMHQFVFDEAARLEKMTILPRIIAEQRQKDYLWESVHSPCIN